MKDFIKHHIDRLEDIGIRLRVGETRRGGGEDELDLEGAEEEEDESDTSRKNDRFIGILWLENQIMKGYTVGL